MNPTHEHGAIFARNRKRRFPISFVALANALFVSALLLGTIGCSSTKQTWKDWAATREAAIPSHEPAVQASAPAPAPKFSRSMLPVHTSALVLAPRYQIGDGAHVSPGFDLKMRNPDFPRTYIDTVYIDLSSPMNGVHIEWTGPKASEGPTGPWRLTPGRGTEGADCDSVEESNTPGSLCTPKGTFPVAGFADHLEQTPICRYATWVLYAPRYVAIHSHTELPSTPASAGCIRVPYEAAKLIHNNGRVGITMIHIGGTWQRLAKKN